MYLFLAFLSLSMGMSLHNAKAVLEGYLGIRTPFIRTPKFNLTKRNVQEGKQKSYLNANRAYLNIVELLFAIYALYGIILAFQFEEFALLPFHLMLFVGCLLVFFYSLLVHFLLRTQKI